MKTCKPVQTEMQCFEIPRLTFVFVFLSPKMEQLHQDGYKWMMYTGQWPGYYTV